MIIYISLSHSIMWTKNSTYLKKYNSYCYEILPLYNIIFLLVKKMIANILGAWQQFEIGSFENAFENKNIWQDY